MMNEWGIPPVDFSSLLHQYASRLAEKGKHLPALAVAGECVVQDQIFKGLAMGAPFVTLMGMARAPIASGGDWLPFACRKGACPPSSGEGT